MIVKYYGKMWSVIEEENLSRFSKAPASPTNNNMYVNQVLLFVFKYFYDRFDFFPMLVVKFLSLQLKWKSVRFLHVPGAIRFSVMSVRISVPPLTIRRSYWINNLPEFTAVIYIAWCSLSPKPSLPAVALEYPSKVISHFISEQSALLPFNGRTRLRSTEQIVSVNFFLQI